MFGVSKVRKNFSILLSWGAQLSYNVALSTMEAAYSSSLTKTCVCVCEFGTPQGCLTISEGPNCFEGPSTWHQSIGSLLAPSNALLIH